MCVNIGRKHAETFRKCADNGKGGGRDVQAENARLRVDGDLEDAARGGVCANSGRIHGDGVQEMHRQRGKMGTMVISCSEMRTEGTTWSAGVTVCRTAGATMHSYSYLYLSHNIIEHAESGQ